MSSKITIRKGDSTNYFYTININLNTTKDLTGWVAYCQIGDIVKKFPDISSKKIPFILTAADTDKIDVGTYSCFVKFIRPDGAVGTSSEYFVVDVIKEVVDV